MVDDFMVCVNRLVIKSTCFDSINNGGQLERHSLQASSNEYSVICVQSGVNGGDGSSCSAKKAKEMVECRICQEEEDVYFMEAPCACDGTLKFAHRNCIQRWCNKKGDNTCEICNQVFTPNYSIPPSCSSPDVVAIDVRQAWGQHISLNDSNLLGLAAAERQLLHAEYEEYVIANTSSIVCLRSVALILLVLFLMSQILLATRDAGIVRASSLYNLQLSLLRFAGFLLPCYVMARSCQSIVQGRRRQG